VLLLERAYPLHNKKLENLIIDFAKERAQAMGLPLVAKHIGTGPAYGKDILFLRGKARFDYMDSSVDIQVGDNAIIPFGKCSVKNAFVLYQPS
jgi:hypothetical protein